MPQKSSGWWGSPAHRVWRHDGSGDPTADAVVLVYNEDLFPGWTFTVTFSPAGVPVGFSVISQLVAASAWTDPRDVPRHRAEAPPVTARWLRSLPLAEIQDTARKEWLRGLEQSPLDRSEAGRWGEVFKAAPRPGRRGRPDRAYAEMAAIYVDELHANRRRAVTAIAERLNYAPSQIRSIVAEARRRGLLTNPPAGRAGGQLTDKAKEILSGDHQAP